MISNLVDYFEDGQEYYLEKIVYDRIETPSISGEYMLNCVENISAVVEGSAVRLTVQRTLSFDPQGIFGLTVSFGAILRFNESKKNEIDWKNINLAEEFKVNGDFATTNLISRISLLIATITSSFGQQPLILPVKMN